MIVGIKSIEKKSIYDRKIGTPWVQVSNATLNFGN